MFDPNRLIHAQRLGKLERNDGDEKSEEDDQNLDL
jgi:hypothetical protein